MSLGFGEVGLLFFSRLKGQIYMAQHGLELRLNADVILAWWDGDSSNLEPSGDLSV